MDIEKQKIKLLESIKTYQLAQLQLTKQMFLELKKLNKNMEERWQQV